MANTNRLLELALKGLEADRARIENEIAELEALRKSGSVSGSGTQVSNGTTGTRRKMSAAARKRISEGMKRRYAEMRNSLQSVQQTKKSESGGLTAAGRKKLSDMMKARWAAKRKVGRKTA
jgi:hypothetical protein